MDIVVEIEDIDSWPKEFEQKALRNKKLLISYHRECRRISKLCIEDVKLRINPPYNKYEFDYNNLLAYLDNILLKHNLLGYHCTRLTSRETSEIKNHGLQILSEKLVIKRLMNAFNDGYLSEIEYNYLKDSKHLKHTINDESGNRTGMIWFCPNRSTLKDSSAIYRLLRNWGGEAVYWGHEKDHNISQTIKNIGLPCIIKCSLPISETEFFHHNYSARFLSYLASDNIEYPEPPASFDLNIKRDLLPNEVLNIIDIRQHEFIDLIDYNKWKDKFPLI